MSQVDNPYAPPEADDLQEPDSADGDGNLVIASQGKRFVNSFVDNVTVRIVSIVIALTSESAWAGLLSIALMLSYYVFCETAFQMTLGKLVTGTMVVDVSGGKPRFTQILGRTFTRLVPFEVLSFFSSHPVGWHDKWSDTRVVPRNSVRTR